jgi:hypothetical protein
VKEAFELDAEFDWYGWTGIKYFLYEYATHLVKEQNKDDDKISWKDLERLKHSIEHILPQTPSDDYWLSRWSESQRKKYTNDIGNLCLTRDNSSYSNKPFPKKRGDASSDQPCYSTGSFLMERNLARDFTDWNEQTLLERRTKIIDWALKRWELSTSGITRFNWRISAIAIGWHFRCADIEQRTHSENAIPRWHFQIPTVSSGWQFGQPSWHFCTATITSKWRFNP